MATIHRNLTGADLHEPKGADTALSGQVYVSDGAGSGTWTTASSIITNTAFSTGDTKLTYKTTADSGWIMPSTNGTIGDGSSSATIRANADCADLFALFWTNMSNTLCPVYTSGGVASTRGASAAADFAAHKQIKLPPITQRAIGIAGGAGDLTARTLGDTTGSETRTLLTANLPPYTPSGTLSMNSQGVLAPSTGAVANQAILQTGTSIYFASVFSSVPTPSGSFVGAAQGGTSTAFSLMNPTTYFNIMIKL